MKDKNLNILSPRTSNPLLYVIYNWKCDVTKFRIPPLFTLRRPPPPPLTCDVTYGCPLIMIRTLLTTINKQYRYLRMILAFFVWFKIPMFMVNLLSTTINNQPNALFLSPWHSSVCSHGYFQTKQFLNCKTFSISDFKRKCRTWNGIWTLNLRFRFEFSS